MNIVALSTYNRRYRYQISAMHYGSISGMLRNDISLRDSILLHVNDVYLKDINSRVNDHLLNDVSSRYTTRMLYEEYNIDIVYFNSFNGRRPYYYYKEPEIVVKVT